MNVRTRLVLGFAVVTGVLTLPTLFATSGLSRLRRYAVEGRAGQASTAATLGRMHATLAELDRLERSFIVTGDPALGEEASARADSLARDFERLSRSPYAEPAATLAPVIEDIAALTSLVYEDVLASRILEATAAFGGLQTAFDEATRRLGSVAETVDALAAGDLVDAEATSTAARTRALIALLVALALTLLVAGVTTHKLTTPLRRLSRATARIADGTLDLPGDLPTAQADEIGELSSAFATMASRLAETNRTKAEFLGIVSHELKTPLNVIKAYAEVIEDELGDDVSDAHRNLITAVGEQANVMSRRVSRLMDLSRLEAGTYRLSTERTPIHHLATGVHTLFRRVAQEKGVRFVVHVSDSAPKDAILDVDIMRDEVLGNLIVNALRFTPKGGSVELAVSGDATTVVFTVTDSGPGIAVEHRAHIFDKHYNGERARAVGSGLGLAIAKEMVDLHGGLITLEDSSEQGGARFRVALPTGAGGQHIETPAQSMVDPAASGAHAEPADGTPILTPSYGVH